MKALIPALALLILNLTDGAAPTTKEKYVYSGEAAGAEFSWQECDTDYWLSSYVSLYGYESVSKILGNGKPETNKYPYVYAWYERWYDCSSDSMTHTYLRFDEPTSMSVDVEKHLRSGSVSLTAQALLVTEVCAEECCDCRCEDGSVRNDCRWECREQGTDSEYKSVTIKATFVGTGTTYTGTDTYTSRYPDSFFHYKYTGTYVDATISSFTFTVDGVTMPIPTDAKKYGTMYTTKDGYFIKYDNGI